MWIKINRFLHNKIHHLRRRLRKQGVVSIWKCRLTSKMIPMLKIRRSRDNIIFNMGITAPGKDDLYIETGPDFVLGLYVLTEC